MRRPKPEKPIFDFGDTFDAEIIINDEPMPISVKRLERAEREAFDKSWDELIAPIGADRELSKEEREDRSARTVVFYEQYISECITLDEGWLRLNGEWVTDGQGMIRMFHARSEVLNALLLQVKVKNHLLGILRKNSNSPRDSAGGSATSNQERLGERPEQIADSAAPKDSASPAAATDVSNESPAPSASDGPRQDAETSVH